MISTELLRRYPFFAGLSLDQLNLLAKEAREVDFEAGSHIIEQDEALGCFYFITSGNVDIIMRVPDKHEENNFNTPSAGTLKYKDISVCSIEPGEMFGWSGLVPPHIATAGAVARTNTRVIEFDCKAIRPCFEGEHSLAYLLTLKAAQTIRERLRCLQVESLALVPV